MSSYKMTMRPVNGFFFGQESKYRKKKKEKGVEADYFQVSALFPQQTTVLGMLRYLVLQENGQIPIKDKQKATELIGETGFMVSDAELGLGVIGSVSPVFVTDGDKAYVPNACDLFLKYEEDGKKFNVERLVGNVKEVKNNFGKTNKMLDFPKFEEKRGISEFLVNAQDSKDVLFFTKQENTEFPYVFDALEKVGITKGKEGQTENKAFYKQIAYQFKRPEMAFAAFVKLDGFAPPKKTLTSFGAEKSLFEITFTETEQTLETLVTHQNEHNAPKVVLLSDAFVENTEDVPVFNIAKSRPFRFLSSTVNGTEKYGQFNEGTTGIKRSNRFNLYSRGSVFFFDNNDAMKKFTDKLEGGNKEKNFYRIGYNHFQTYTGS